jgi:predicted GIY-YIG superfamily endonuclease
MIKKIYILYILELANGAYYTGITTDLEKRIQAHSEGKGSKYVRSHLPAKIVFTKQIEGRSSASKLEAAIKSLTHSEKEKIINDKTQW